MTTSEFKAILINRKVNPYKFAIDNEISLTPILIIFKGDIHSNEVIQALKRYKPKQANIYILALPWGNTHKLLFSS